MSGAGELIQGLKTREPPKAITALIFLAIDNIHIWHFLLVQEVLIFLTPKLGLLQH